MAEIRVGNAPCSWGSLEFEGLDKEPIGCLQMLDELAETGYTGTELGDWGFMPTDPALLASALDARGVVMLGAFVPVAFADVAAHDDGETQALKTAHLIAQAAALLKRQQAPFLVLADNNGADPVRTKHAGRVTPEMGLDEDRWKNFAEGVNRIARAVQAETGLKTVFHHHCGGFIETPDEVAKLMELTDPSVVGLVLDTGHLAYGAGNTDVVMAALERFADRLWYVHFKDCEPEVAAKARAEGWDYFEAVQHGVFCELGQGCVDFPAVLAWLRARDYDGYVTVEQDVLPGMGMPKESARRNREYLQQIGL